jgi:hypothetical protein
VITDTHVHVYPPDVVRYWEKIARKERILLLLSEERFTAGRLW